MNRYHENTLNDYSPQSNYLNEFDELKHEYAEQIHNYLKKTIKNVQETLDDEIDPRDFSFYSGMSGTSYMFLRYYLETKNEKYLNLAESLIKMSLKAHAHDRITFLCGSIGSLAMAAYMAHLKGDYESSRNYTNNILKQSTEIESCKSDELLYGRAGYLYTLLFIRKNINPQLVPDSQIEDVFNLIIKSGKNYSVSKNFAKLSPLMFAWHDTEYVGAAHGLAGIIHILLLAMNEVSSLNKHLDTIIVPSLDFIRNLKYSSGNYMSSIDSKTDKLVQYCHGSPGVEMTFSLAYKITRKQEYLQEALECGQVTWERGLLKKGYGLCHGVGGNAYAFIDLFNLTNDQKWLHRAYKFAEWCTQSRHIDNFKPERKLSLYEGIPGTIVFLLDLTRPKRARFPGYQL